MYGTSLVRAWLNQGGDYLAKYKDVELTPWNVTFDATYNELTEFLSGGKYADLVLTPRQIAWQADESAVAVNAFRYNFANDAYQIPKAGNFTSSNVNYTGKTGYDNWADDKLWLASVAELGYTESGNNMKQGIFRIVTKYFEPVNNVYKGLLRSVFGTSNFTLMSGDLFPRTYSSNNYADYSGPVTPAMHIDLSADELQACNHEWGAWTETQRATCINDGAREHTCTVCNKTVSEPIPATGNHVYGEWIVDTAATCVTDGAQHCICVDDPECTARLDEVVPATGIHTYDDGVVTTPPGCATEGVMTYTCTQCHTATTTSAIPPTGDHHWDKDHVVKHEDPVCGEAGYNIYQCQDCTAVTREIVPPLEEHEYGEWETVTEATEDAPGEESRECSKCHHLETREVPKLPAPQSSFTGEKAMVVILLVVGGLTCFAILIMTLAAMDKTRRQTQPQK